MAKIRALREPILTLREGSIYLYTASQPTGCKGCRYKVLKLVEHVPVGQKLVCVQCLEGPDEGKWFVCSEANFARHYEPLPPEPPEQEIITQRLHPALKPVDEKAAGAVHTGTGV